MSLSNRLASGSIWRVAALVSSLTLVAFVSTQPQVSNDFWLQAKIGQLILEQRKIPETLLFPFTQASEFKFNAHEWLASILFYYFIQVFGESGLPLLLGFTGILLFTSISLIASRRAGGNMAIGLLCGLLAIVIENYRHYLRPELLSIFLLLSFLHCLDRIREKPSLRYIAFALFIYLLWINSHGSFILAPVLCALYMCGIWMDRLRPFTPDFAANINDTHHFVALFVAMSFCTLANPSGIHLVQFVFSYSGSAVSREFITEWFPTFDPRLRHSSVVWIGLVACLCSIIICFKYWRHISAVDILICVFFVLLGLKVIRFLIYVGIISIQVIAIAARSSPQVKNTQTALHQGVTISCCALLVLAFNFGNMNGNFPYKSNFPEVLTSPMKRALSSPDLEGNIYNSYDLGAEIIFRAYPRLRPSIDSRIDSYGDAYFLEHEKLLTDSDLMNRFASNFNVHLMLLTRDDLDIFRQNHEWKEGRWSILILDERAALLKRTY